jgi:phosphate transport system permease protein
VVTAGGVGIVAGILGILAFLVVEILPLLDATRVTPARALSAQEPETLALLVDEHRSHAVTLARDGLARVYDLETGEPVAEHSLLERNPTGPTASGVASDETSAAPTPPLTAARAEPTDGTLTAATSGGDVVILPVDFRISFDGRSRRVHPEVGEPLRLELDAQGGPLRVFAARWSEGQATAVAQLEDGSLRLVRREVRENLMTGAREELLESQELGAPGPLSHLILTENGRELYGASQAGDLLWWNLASARSAGPQRVSAGPSPVTALALLIGERSLVVGQADGSMSVWFGVAPRRGRPELTRIRDFPPLAAGITLLAPSLRNRSFLASDAAGNLGLYFSTSSRVLWTGRASQVALGAAAFAPKGDAVHLAGEGRLVELSVENPHPETTLGSLFGRVWYEGGTEPEYVWQSTGGTDQFEAKLSLIPLLIGTLKGTLYSLLLAVPLGVLGAMYTSQFMHPRLQRIVKPSVEIMASLPSVVLGFLAGLWLAPRLEGAFTGFLLCLVAFPLAAVAAGLLVRLVPLRLRGRWPDGTEVFWFAAVIALAMSGCFALGGPLETVLFDGSFSAWLLDSSGVRYDQRNAVVIGIAMGFAVIPIIFAIAEDAFSNVPRSLAAASRALGANRWQTVVRVVLPTASPGIFSAIMVGFGRAVGETMIVLMATGNTPILDWSAFNGFRTLSANIAVEIPEAPVGGSLYRTLFVAALLLFALTFLFNTLAEVIRHRLRQRYARL